MEELYTNETGSTSTRGGLGAVCAVPLFGGPAVAGALLLEAGPATSVQPFVSEVEKLNGSDQQNAKKKRARQRLFSSPALLHQLGLAVLLGLDLAGEQLLWMARALHRISSCVGMNSLVWELCEELAAHVKRRLIVEAAPVRAALLPRADAPLGLLFHAQPCSNSGAGSGLGGRCRSADPGPTQGQGLTQSERSSVECTAAVPMPPAPLGGQLLGHAAMQPCTKLGVLSRLESRNRLGAPATSSGAGSSDCGAATSRLSKRPASTNLVGEPSASGRVLTLFSDALPGAGVGRPADPHQHQTTTATMSSPASRATIVVQLPPHMAAEAPSASLHAQAFPLKHTVLQALAAEAAASNSIGSGGGFPGACIEDVAPYLQKVHNPSRDVCLLLGGMRAGGQGQPGSPRTPHAVATALSPLHPGGGFAAGGAGSPCPGGGSGAALQSLVLVGLGLGDSVLAFYLCFPKRLPRELLVAVRDSCNELLGEVFASPVRAKLEGSLAAEFETLRATTPGHFAVLRSSSVNGLMAAHRPGSHGNVSFRTAARVIAPPRASCGAILQAKTLSGCSESCAAAAPRAVAIALGAAAEGAGGVAACVSASKLSRRPSIELSCSSQVEITLFTATCAARGPNMARTVSFSMERGAAGVGAAGVGAAEYGCLTGANGGARGGGAGADAPRMASREAPVAAVALANDELMNVLLQMRQSETACCSLGGDPRSASIMTVTGVDAGTTVRQQLDMLVNSIQTTMTTELNGAMVAFTEDLESLELLEILGKGGGGVVYKGRLGTQEVAVKVMELPDLDVGDASPQHLAAAAAQGAGARSGHNGCDAEGAHVHAPNPAAAAAVAKEQLRARRALLRNAMEMAVQGRVSHPNLVQVYATYTNVVVERRARADGSAYHCLVPADLGVHDLGLQAPPTTYCAIVAELADCGSLAAALGSRVFPLVMLVPRVPGAEQQHPFELDLRGVYMTLLDVALALRHLHSLNLVHRDIKPANLLLKSNPRDYRGFTVKLSDFGFVLHLTEVAEDGTRYVMVDQACGTVTHMAPELLPGKARVDASADVYSFGILMWELVSGGVRPFPNLHPDHIPRHVYKGARPIFGDVVPLSYRGLAQACWAAEAHRRPKAADLVALITAQMEELE